MPGLQRTISVCTGRSEVWFLEVMDVLVGTFLRVSAVPVKRYSLRYPNITTRDECSRR
jgi:hypothetical protein